MKVKPAYDTITLHRHFKVTQSLPTKCLGTNEFFRPEHLTITYRMSTDEREAVVGIWQALEARVWGSMVDRPESGHAYGDRVYFLNNKNVRVPRDLAKIVRDHNPGINRAA